MKTARAPGGHVPARVAQPEPAQGAFCSQSRSELAQERLTGGAGVRCRRPTPTLDARAPRAAVWQPKGLGRPEVAACRQRAAVGLGACEQRVDVLASYPEGAADLRGGQRAAVDPVADRLSGHLELLGDLGDGQDLLLGRRQLRAK